MGVPPALIRLSSHHPKCSNLVIGNCMSPFSYMVEGLFDPASLNFDINNRLLTNARDYARWRLPLGSTVSLSSRTFCPMFLRQIPQNHHMVEARAPLKPMCGPLAHACMCVLAVLLMRVQRPHLNSGCWTHTSWISMVLGAVRGGASICARPTVNFLRSEVVVRCASAQRVVTALGARHFPRTCTAQ